MTFQQELTALIKKWKRLAKKTPVGQPLIHFIDLYKKHFAAKDKYIKVLESQIADMRKIIKRKK